MNMTQKQRAAETAQRIDAAAKPAELARVSQVAPDMITIDKRRYQISKDYRNAFDRERFATRYNDILAKFDYIVGDWGYDQLRLRGFYENGSRQANKEQQIGALEDYLYEYCNFGCAYFVLTRLDAPAVKPARRRPHGSRRRSDTRDHKDKNTGGQAGGPKGTSRRQSHGKKAPLTAEKSGPSVKIMGQQAETVAPTKPRKRHFKIRQRESNTKQAKQ